MCTNNGDIREVSRGSKSIFMKLMDEREKGLGVFRMWKVMYTFEIESKCGHVCVGPIFYFSGSYFTQFDVLACFVRNFFGRSRFRILTLNTQTNTLTQSLTVVHPLQMYVNLIHTYGAFD